jgi:hypothetical protein
MVQFLWAESIVTYKQVMQNLFPERMSMTREIDRETEWYGFTYGDGRLEGHLPVCASISAASHTARGEIEDGVFHCHNVAAL